MNPDEDPYTDGTLYDLEYESQQDDVRWYVRRAMRAPGPVLELGCGTGRVTLPVARTGVQITGVDLAPDMLGRLRTKLDREPEQVQACVTLIEGDYRTVDLGRSYGAVLWPFNALHHAHHARDVGTVLARAANLLRPKGFVLLDCYLPDVEVFDRDPEERNDPRSFAHPRTGEPIESWEHTWWEPERQIYHVRRIYESADGKTERHHFELRMYAPAQLRKLVSDAGLRVVEEHQDFVGTPLGPRALKWVVTARPTKR